MTKRRRLGFRDKIKKDNKEETWIQETKLKKKRRLGLRDKR